MPSSSEKQSKLMTAVCKNSEFRKKVGVPKKVGCEYHRSDKGKYHEDVELTESDVLEIASDELSELLDDGISVENSIGNVVQKYNIKNMEELLNTFKRLYLATPEEYVANMQDDSEWEGFNMKKEQIGEELESLSMKENEDEVDSHDIPRLMKMAGIKKRLEDGEEENPNHKIKKVAGLYKGVARGDISVGDKGKIGEAFSFLKELTPAKAELLEAGNAEKTEHSGAKKGKGAYYGKKEAAKKESNKKRREADKKSSKVEEQLKFFKKDSIERIMVEMIAEQIKSGKNVKQISENLSVHIDDVKYIHDWVLNRKK